MVCIGILPFIERKQNNCLRSRTQWLNWLVETAVLDTKKVVEASPKIYYLSNVDVLCIADFW